MLKTSPLQSLSTTQRIVAVIIALVFVFLIFGTLSQSAAPEPTFNFGLQAESFFVLAILSFAGGLLSFASPCTLPILPAYFAFAFQSGRRQIAANTLAFLLGLATMFSLLGAGASALGRILQQNTGIILLVGGAAVLVFGVMSLLGQGFTGMQATEQTRSTTLGGSYVFGVTFAVGWSSCVGPILGTVLTLAATTGSVLRGVMLLFIYALGLGLPLVIVSTLFGRASRQSLFWRILRGKGWDMTVPTFAIAAIWVITIWRILVAVVDYGIANFSSEFGQSISAGQEWGLIIVAIIGVGLWYYTSNQEKETLVHFHSTQLISGALFILLGFLMLSGRLATFNSLIPPDLALWFADIEEGLVELFN